VKIEVIHASEMLVHLQSTQSYIPEEGFFHNYHCENVKILHILYGLTQLDEISCRPFQS
jgi:hypothetical protein